jgi:hypothetical protein
MPSDLFCKICLTFSLKFDPETKSAVCENCKAKVTPQIRSF